MPGNSTDFTVRFLADVKEAVQSLQDAADANRGVDQSLKDAADAARGQAASADETAAAMEAAAETARDAAESLDAVADNAADAADSMDDMGDNAQDASRSMGGMGAASDALEDSLGKAGGALAKLGQQIPGVGGQVVTATGELLKSANNPVSFAITAVSQGLALLQSFRAEQEAIAAEARAHQDAMEKAHGGVLAGVDALTRRLQDINSSESLTNEQRETAVRLVDMVNAAYGRQLIQIDRVTGKVQGLNALRARVQLEQFRLRQAPLQRELAELEGSVPTRESVRAGLKASYASAQSSSMSGFGGAGLAAITDEMVDKELARRMASREVEGTLARIEELKLQMKGNALSFAADSQGLDVLFGAMGATLGRDRQQGILDQVSDARRMGVPEGYATNVTDALHAYQAGLAEASPERLDAALRALTEGTGDTDAIGAALGAAARLTELRDSLLDAVQMMEENIPDTRPSRTVSEAELRDAAERRIGPYSSMPRTANGMSLLYQDALRDLGAALPGDARAGATAFPGLDGLTEGVRSIDRRLSGSGIYIVREGN